MERRACWRGCRAGGSAALPGVCEGRGEMRLRQGDAWSGRVKGTHQPHDGPQTQWQAPALARSSDLSSGTHAASVLAPVNPTC